MRDYIKEEWRTIKEFPDHQISNTKHFRELETGEIVGYDTGYVILGSNIGSVEDLFESNWPDFKAFEFSRENWKKCKTYFIGFETIEVSNNRRIKGLVSDYDTTIGSFACEDVNCVSFSEDVSIEELLVDAWGVQNEEDWGKLMETVNVNVETLKMSLKERLSYSPLGDGMFINRLGYVITNVKEINPRLFSYEGVHHTGTLRYKGLVDLSIYAMIRKHCWHIKGSKKRRKKRQFALEIEKPNGFVGDYAEF